MAVVGDIGQVGEPADWLMNVGVKGAVTQGC
jgi:hypothetical protein